MDRNAVIGKLGLKTTGGSRDAVVNAFKKAAEKGLSVAEIGAVAGSQSKTGDISRTVASLITHLRKKEGCDIVKDTERYFMIGTNSEAGWTPEPWVAERFNKE